MSAIRFITSVIMLGAALSFTAAAQGYPEKALALDGAEPSGGTPVALAAYHKADYEKWGAVIIKAGIKAK